MNERHLTDAELTTALRAWVPRAAPSGSRDRFDAGLRTTRQQRPVPFPLAPLFDADPAGRRLAMAIAAALLLAAALAGAVAVGAMRLTLSPGPDLSLEPPLDLQAYMVSVAQDSPIVRPMALTVVRDEPRDVDGAVRDDRTFQRVYMDASGSVRIEDLASADATDAETYAISSSDRHVELARQGAEPVWIEEVGPTDPRDWIFMTTAAYIGVADRGCEMAELDPTAHWEYVGLEELLGRPVHHVRCDGDFWVDVETRLVLRSRSSDPQPRTVEVTSLELGPQPAALFDATRPDGLRSVTREEQNAYEEQVQVAADCAADPVCSAPEVPLETPPPAAGARSPDDVTVIVARALAARDAAPPLHVTVNHWRSKGGVAGQDRLDYVRPNHFRVESGPDAITGARGQTDIAVNDEEFYESTIADDGSVTWRRAHPNPRTLDVVDWLDGTLMAIPVPDACEGGWRLLGVDSVGPFTADHLACEGTEYWVDRETSLVVRRQSTEAHADAQVTVVSEVVELTFGGSPEERFRLPDGAVLEPEPTPDPNFVPTTPPQPSAGG